MLLLGVANVSPYNSRKYLRNKHLSISQFYFFSLEKVKEFKWLYINHLNSFTSYNPLNYYIYLHNNQALTFS